ncbi:MAG: superoxide dismutase, Ni, partial [Candidatus Spechtbacterales bacterium]
MLLRAIEKLLSEGVVLAHCDVPCGIYSTHQAGIAAETVEVMVDKIVNPPSFDASNPESVRNFHNAMTRFVMAKEEWAEICKKELLILWTDYFKDEHLTQFPDLHD